MLFCHPNLQPPGGGQAVAAWMLQTLLEGGHEVHILGLVPFDPAPVDRAYGTGLVPLRPRLSTTVLRSVPVRALRRLPLPLDLLQSALLLRACRAVEGDHDLVVTAHNEWPVAGPCVSYVHYPSRARPRPVADLRWYHGRQALRAYYGLSDRLADFTTHDIRRHTLIANSPWTADVLRRVHGVDAVVIEPPVGPFDDDIRLASGRRSNTFVAAGRFASEKRHADLVAIVDGVRRRGHNVRLALVGGGSDADIARARGLASGTDFVDVVTGLDVTAYRAFLGRCRFGLHAMHDEHFGIAPAEMIEAGCLPFVHRSGGPIDIVGDAALTFVDVDDAIARIDAVLGDQAEQRRLLDHVEGRRGRFGLQHFQRRFAEVVDAALGPHAKKERGAGPLSR